MAGATEFPTDYSIARALRNGGRAYHVADRLGIPDRHLRRVTRRLQSLEKSGMVRRSERYSVPNSYFWELTDRGADWVNAGVSCG
jgi:DNA-binding HxlR family transcriptional regulator